MTCAGWHFIDSAGLEILVRVIKRGRAAGLPPRGVVLPASQPERVLYLGRFETLMQIDSLPLE